MKGNPSSLLPGSIIFICALTTVSFAQTFRELYPNPIAPGGNIAWADYDNDGDPDLVTSGVLKDGVGKSILYRNTDGQFEAVQEFEEPSGYIQWMDLDDDGDLDLIFGHTQIKILINENGTFVDQPRGGYYRFQVWTDYNNDGDPDMFASTNEGVVKFYKQSGTLLQYVVGRFSEVTALNVGDYNGDGHYDLLVQRGPVHASAISLYTNDGNENFTPDKNNTFITIPIVSLYSFDFDDDGDTDILLTGKVSDQDARSGYLYENNAGRFELTTDPFFQTGYPRARKVTSDVNFDLIKASDDGDSVEYYENKGNGQYSKMKGSPVSEYLAPLNFAYASSIGEPDDAYLCISGSLYNGNWSTRIYHRKNGVYENSYPNPFDQLSASNLLQWTDYDHDGLMDAYVSGRSSPAYGPYARLLKNTGVGFDPVYDFPYDKIGRGEWVDFNKDGEIDFLTVVGRDVLLYEGFATGAVSVKTILTQVDEGTHPKVVDFDLDGDNDIFIDGYFQGLYVNDNGVFTKSITFGDFYSWTGESDWADYDLDGDEDVVLYVESGNLPDQPHLYNNDEGSFTNVPDIPFPPMGSAYVRWIDYNLDGYPDLFILELNSVDVHSYRMTPLLYKNDGKTFTPESAAAFSGLQDIAWYNDHFDVADINNDGYADIVIGGRLDDDAVMLMYLNNKGHFELSSDHRLPGLFDVNFDWSDFDHDGDSDLLLSGWKDNPLTQVYVNTIEDQYPPVAKSFSPANNSTLQQKNVYKLSIEFHENITSGSGAMHIYRKSDNAQILEIDASNNVVTITGKTAEIIISENVFTNGEDIYVLIDEGFVNDNRNNPFEGISDPEKWNLTIHNDKASQTITFSLPETVAITDTPTVNLTATSSSGLPIKYESTDASVATIVGNVLTVTGLGTTGTTGITASQSGNESFNAATPVTRNFTVKKGTQEIIFEAIPEKHFGEDPFALNATASSGLPVSFTSADPGIATVEGNMVTIVQAGEATITAYQPGNNVFMEAQPETRSLVVTVTTGIGESQQHKISISPNPATSWITITCPGESAPQPLTFGIYNGHGKLATRGTGWANESNDIDLQFLTPGIYLVLIDLGNRQWRGRLVKL